MNGLLGRIGISWRLYLISVCYTFPLAVLLVLVVQTINSDIAFSLLEKSGNRLQRSLEDTLEPLLVASFQTRRVAAGQADARGTLSRSLDRVDAALAGWRQIDQELGVELQFTESGLRKRGRQHLQIGTMTDEWRELRNQLSAPARTAEAGGAIEDAFRHLVADLRAAITHAGDNSNLILDPNLDSYYLMDVTLLALPQAHERIADMVAQTEPLLVALADKRRALTPAERHKLGVLATLFAEADLRRIETSVATSVNEDPNCYGSSPTLQRVVPALERFASPARELVALLEQVAGGGSANLTAFQQVADRAQAASFELWRTAVVELDVLLDARLAARRSWRTWTLSLSLAALAMAALFVGLIVRSIRRPLITGARALSSMAGTLEQGSADMARKVSETTSSVAAASTAADEVSQRVQSVAAAAEDLGQTIREIARNATQAAVVANTAVTTAEVTNDAMGRLGVSTMEVGNVVKVISGIAAQTNLLALNATIEAARAGEVGRGFAVVANEVKELAKATARATEEVGRRIEAIQKDSQSATTAIHQITNIIADINSFQTGVASAVEEQSVTLTEIGRNMAEAAQECTDIAGRVATFRGGLESQTKMAEFVRGSARNLGHVAGDLAGLIGRGGMRIRKAEAARRSLDPSEAEAPVAETDELRPQREEEIFEP